MTIKRREFLVSAGGALTASAALCSIASAKTSDPEPHGMRTGEQPISATSDGQKNTGMAIDHSRHVFNGPYEGEYLDRIAFPLGGMGAGSICLEGTGTLSKFSLWHRPNLLNSPTVFAALSVKTPVSAARVLEGPLPGWKLFPDFTPTTENDRREGRHNMALGFPRFRGARFSTRFPFATVKLEDDQFPLEVELTGWSPISPNDTNNASLPVAAVEYTVRNSSAHEVKSVFSFNSMNFMAAN